MSNISLGSILAKIEELFGKVEHIEAKVNARRDTLPASLDYTARQRANAEMRNASPAELAIVSCGFRSGVAGSVGKFLLSQGAGTYTYEQIAKATGFSVFDVYSRIIARETGVAKRINSHPACGYRVEFVEKGAQNGVTVVSLAPAQKAPTKAQDKPRKARKAKVAEPAENAATEQPSAVTEASEQAAA
jgi:hypothetical protein